MLPIATTIDIKSSDDIHRLTKLLQANAQHHDVDIRGDDVTATLQKFESDFAFYAPRCLFIKTKSRGLLPFVFNTSQWYLHTIIEWQLATTGKVRVIVVKGRQQGISTYTEGRGYWKQAFRVGYNVTILTHEDKATQNLFDMAKRYHENCPEFLQPAAGKYNGNNIEFPEQDNVYKVFTAKSKGTGRSNTISFFHGSEVAFWANAEEHSSGIMEGISEEDDTEVLLESTAYGNANYFADMWDRADYPGETPDPHGNGYMRVFIPWFWEPAYRTPLPDGGLELTAEEIEYKDLHGLTDEQIFWRRRKIAKMGGDVNRFRRDYPATPEDAFNAETENMLISPDAVVRARKAFKANLYSAVGAVVFGVDVAREGDDSSCIVVRRGRVIIHYERMYKKKSHEVAARVNMLAREWHPSRIFIDGTGGYGAGVYDFLTSVYGSTISTLVNFAEAADDPKQFKNKRAEIWWRLKTWVEDACSVPDSLELQKDFCAMTYSYVPGTDQMIMKRKSDMKKDGLKSPDIGDAAALTFSYAVTEGYQSSGNSYEPESE